MTATLLARHLFDSRRAVALSYVDSRDATTSAGAQISRRSTKSTLHLEIARLIPLRCRFDRPGDPQARSFVTKEVHPGGFDEPRWFGSAGRGPWLTRPDSFNHHRKAELGDVDLGRAENARRLRSSTNYSSKAICAIGLPLRGVARPTRFERVTSTFGGWRSIQLSYGRISHCLFRATREGQRIRRS